MFGKLAVMNLLQHLKRTLLILFAVAVAVMVMEIVSGVFEGMREGFFRNLTQTGGHVVVRSAGWENRLSPYSIEYPINEADEVSDLLLQGDGVAAAEPLLTFGTLLLFKEDNYTLAGQGVIPDGQLFVNVREHVQEGAFLPEGRGVVLGRSTAELMGIVLGDAVSLLVEDATGSPYYLVFPVVGIYDTGAEDFDSSNLFISLQDARDLLYLDDAATEIRIRLDDPDRAEAYAEWAESREDINLNRTGQQENGAEHGLAIQTWKEREGSIVTLLEAMDVMILVMDLLVIIVAASLITNALLMNMLDRIAEFGTMRAIGLKRRQLFGMILTEGALQGVLGSLLGLAAGVPLVIWLAGKGLDFGAVTESLGIGSSLFYLAWDPLNSLVNAVAGTLVALAGSLYAAKTAVGIPILKTLAEE